MNRERTVVAASSGINPAFPASLEEISLPLVLIRVLFFIVVSYCERVWTEVADFQALEVAHEVLERHPANFTTKLQKLHLLKFYIKRTNRSVISACKMKTT